MLRAPERASSVPGDWTARRAGPCCDAMPHVLRILLTTLILGRATQAWAGEAATLDGLLATVPGGGVAGVAMAELDQRQWVVRRGADQPLSLASTTKLITTAAAVIGLGTARTFDVSAERDIAVRRQVIEHCLAAQVTFLDSSPMYGQSERVIGLTTEDCRGHFQFATKVWCHGRAQGETQIEHSFRLLKTDYIDLLQIHNLVDWKTHLGTLERLQSQGRIGLIGIMALWLGMMNIAKDAGLIDGFARLMRPLMRWLFPEVPDGHPAQGAILMNL